MSDETKPDESITDSAPNVAEQNANPVIDPVEASAVETVVDSDNEPEFDPTIQSPLEAAETTVTDPVATDPVVEIETPSPAQPASETPGVSETEADPVENESEPEQSSETESSENVTVSTEMPDGVEPSVVVELAICSTGGARHGAQHLISKMTDEEIKSLAACVCPETHLIQDGSEWQILYSQIGNRILDSEKASSSEVDTE